MNVKPLDGTFAYQDCDLCIKHLWLFAVVMTYEQLFLLQTHNQQLSSHQSILWLCFGDFNQILDHENKLSFSQTLTGAQDFNEVIFYCGLMDLKLRGVWYT